MITLYDLPVSSYGCKIRVMMTHKQLKWRSIPPPDGYGSPAYCKIIPKAGTIPTIDQDGFRLADSEAIAEYLDETVATMLPKKLIQRIARASAKFLVFATRAGPLLRAYFEHVSPETRSQNFIASNTVLLQKRLDQLGQIVNPTPLLFSNQLSIADCGFVQP